jgi:uncharacterized protein (TIGR03118 family)
MKFALLLPLSAPLATLLVLSGCGGSSSSTHAGSTSSKFVQTNLVSDTSGNAAVTDPNLVNPWGVSFAPSGAFWVSDNGTGLSTLYNTSGAIQPLVVKIPAANNGTNGPVSGQVYNGGGGFALPGRGSSIFIFCNEDGVISGWNNGTSAVEVVDRSGTGAVYKGLALAANGGANFLYAANFNSGQVDVFDTTFTYQSSFTDSGIPSGFAPFGIQTINGQLYVTFAKQDSAKHDDVAGPGNGYVDVFNPNGTLVKRLVSAGALNSPWGLAVAPSGFGNLGGALLVGNFGDGHINAYNTSTGASMGALNSTAGTPLAISGLWALIFGNGGQGGTTGTLYFTAGPGSESHGLFGSLTPSS